MDQNNYWKICEDCKGLAKKTKRIGKKAVRLFKQKKQLFEAEVNKNPLASNGLVAPKKPKKGLHACATCYGYGLVKSNQKPILDLENFPHIAIVGGGIGGAALAVACFHRGIPFTLFEKDVSFNARAQGYGLTLQQASKAIKALGIMELEEGVVSTRHLVHNTKGTLLGEWGSRKWVATFEQNPLKRRNIHISRQALRASLLAQLKGSDHIKWGHEFTGATMAKDQKISLHFKVNGQIKEKEVTEAHLLVGADGIFSKVRPLIIEEELAPLRYLGCMVILGICPLEKLKTTDQSLLDGATVFQTANGHERIYIMPFNATTVMWQLSFPISEKEAKTLHAKGAAALKAEACKRTAWHSPVPEIVRATVASSITGYPAYDRAVVPKEMLKNNQPITLLGDAAHPMSPFKGQGANQALLDALSLARIIFKNCNAYSNWKQEGLRAAVLHEFETEMWERSSSKVIDSAAAARFLHSEIVLQKADAPRGSLIKN